MTFPTPHTVQHSAFNGVGVDSLGNDVESWDTPVSVKVIAYGESAVESRTGYSSRVVSDVDMAVPPSLKVSVRDRFVLPAGEYEVVGIEDANHGFHQWTPGYVVKLNRVSG